MAISYDPKKVRLTLNGMELEGFADGTVITRRHDPPVNCRCSLVPLDEVPEIANASPMARPIIYEQVATARCRRLVAELGRKYGVDPRTGRRLP